MPVYPEMSRRIAVSKIGTSPVHLDLEASVLECKQIADRLHIPLIEKFRVRYTLIAEKERIKAHGILNVTLRQQCVVSLEIFSTNFEEEFDVHFVPKEAMQEDIFVDPDQIDEIPYEKGYIDLGEAAIEQLALLLDLYPHKPGLSKPFIFSTDSHHTLHEVVRTSPFAALATLKDRHVASGKNGGKRSAGHAGKK